MTRTYSLLHIRRDEQWAISNKNSAFLWRCKAEFSLDRPSLISYRVQCAIGIIHSNVLVRVSRRVRRMRTNFLTCSIKNILVLVQKYLFYFRIQVCCTRKRECHEVIILFFSSFFSSITRPICFKSYFIYIVCLRINFTYYLRWFRLYKRCIQQIFIKIVE